MNERGGKMRRKNRKSIIFFFAWILFIFIIFLSNQLFIDEAICAQSPANKKLSFLTMNPAKTTIRIGEIAVIKLIANYENGSQEIVKTEKFKGEETGVFPIVSEYKGEKTLILARVFVIENKEIEEVVFRPENIIIEIGTTVTLNLIAIYKDSSEGIISTEKFKGTGEGTFPLSSSFEGKKATANIGVKNVQSPTRRKYSDYTYCPRLHPCSDCHAINSH